MTTTEQDLYAGYRAANRASGAAAPSPAADAALARVVRERIRELRINRRWYRQRANPVYWFDLYQETKTEARILLRLLRKSRQAETAGWTEAELRLAAGDR